MQLSGRTILVTGASGGIGSELSRQLTEQGATLVLSGFNTPGLERLRDELPGHHQAVAADIAAADGRKTIVAACASLNGVDAVINLAGMLDFRLFCEQSEDVIDRLMQVNVVGPMLLTRMLLPQLLGRRQARIVNVGSIFGHIGHPGFVAYCASKAALHSFSEALARELADTTVSVAYIAPRATSTPLNDDRVTALNRVLGNRCDSPDVVAAAILRILAGKSHQRFLGWPEPLIVRLNALLPAVVHAALVKKLPLIKHHAKA